MSDVPAALAGRIIHIEKPSLALAHRDAATYSDRTGLGCATTAVKRDQDIKSIMDNQSRHSIHYRFVFPFEIDHRIFNDANDEDFEVHRFNVSVVLPPDHPKNHTGAPLVQLTVAWRVGKFGATKTSSATKPAIDFASLIS